MPQTKEQWAAEVRYAQRLCQITARLYRRAQTTFTFLSVFTGSATLISLAAQMPPKVTIGGAVALAAIGAINIAMRPAEKVAANDADVRKYALLLTKGVAIVDIAELDRMLAEARQSDVPEVEPLRDVAFNQVMGEINRPDHVVKLRLAQRLLGALA